jgi:DNA ligase (NAD+)
MTTKEIRLLEKQIRAYQKAYYAGESVISDAEFDRLWDRLALLNPASPVLSRVGPDNAGSVKAEHIIHMGSQKKARGHEGLRDWMRTTGAASYAVQFKLDGASLELQYRDGALVRALTRGNGVTGSDITRNALRMGGVLAALDIPFSGGIRGEVLLPRALWREKHGGVKTSRDIGNGIMIRKDGRGCEDLVFIAYDAAVSENDGFFEGEIQKIMWLKERGFSVTETKHCSGSQAVIAWYEAMAKTRHSLPVDIDGLVIKDCLTDMNDLRRNYPKRQIAIKFEDDHVFQEELQALKTFLVTSEGAAWRNRIAAAARAEQAVKRQYGLDQEPPTQRQREAGGVKEAV